MGRGRKDGRCEGRKGKEGRGRVVGRKREGGGKEGREAEVNG